MSGIVGIINLEGAPVGRQLLRRMTACLAYRGPDAQETWVAGPVGFGHAMLRTTSQSASERQPATLDGEVWITADARVDARADLLPRLRSEGRLCHNSATDPELILHAYHVWGEECVQHLLGDFAFAIWDGRERRLFCARDHFGVKPFYYARVGNCLVFSNTLSCLRLHPRVSDQLNDLAIADFLLFDFNQDPATTTFADVRRLPPAHSLTWSLGTLRIRRYWTLPVDEPLRYKRASDYVEHFRELLHTAVEDRLRTDRVGVFMSGGLDSSSVAAAAKEVLSKQSALYDLRAYTTVYERLIPDEERHYAGLVAQALRIPIHYLVADGYKLYERWDQPELCTPEPSHQPLAAMAADQLREVAARQRVVLTGCGADPALCTSLSFHFSKLLHRLRLRSLVADFGRYVTAEGRLSRLYVRARLRILFGKNRWRRLYPTWLNREFSAGLDLPARWEQLHGEPAPNHALRPAAYGMLIAPDWPNLFESYDPGVTFAPVESRHPFFDLRVVRYLLALPPLPWCADKELLRAAMRGVLPERVRLRPKSPMASDPFGAAARRGDVHWVKRLAPAPPSSAYVDWDRVPNLTGQEEPNRFWLDLRPVSLNLWCSLISQANEAKPMGNLLDPCIFGRRSDGEERPGGELAEKTLPEPGAACLW